MHRAKTERRWRARERYGRAGELSRGGCRDVAGGDNLLACAHPQMREIPSKCGLCGALFPCLPGVSSTAAEWRPCHCCERSRAAALSLDKAGDPNALLLYIVRGRNQGTGWHIHARPRDVLYRLRGLSTSMTMTTPPPTRRLFVTLLLSNARKSLAEGSRKNKKRILGNCEI